MYLKPKTKTLKQGITRALVKSVSFTLALGLGFAVFPQTNLDTMTVSPERGSSSSRVMENRPIAEGSPASLVAEHSCWTGKAPENLEDKMPGHVVFTKDGVPQYSGGKMVGQALDQIFNGIDHSIIVYGFCR